MPAIGIDLGDKRCGIAIEIGGLSIPKDIVDRTKIISVIKSYCTEYACDTIVVGLPYDLYEKKIRQLDKTHKFISKLELIFPNKKIIGVDERFTSFEADIVLKESGIFNTRGNKDDISAQIILETYLSQSK